MKATRHPLWVAALSLPALLYGTVVRLRNRRYDAGERSRRAALPVVSVGNLTVGGTGKTPIVAWLARHLRSRGLRPAIVSRGYAGRVGRGPLLVSDGSGPLCPAAQSGDEPHLLARSLPEVLVIAGADRLAGARCARQHGADVILLDDGFQHRRLARDLDVVLLDASNPFGNHRLLPAGLLREPVSSLARADAIVVTRARPGETFPLIERVVRYHNRRAPLLTGGHRVVGFFDPAGQPADRPRRAVAFCAIGNPSRFRIDLESEGVEVARFQAHRDHHAYSERELEGLRRLAAECGAALVTTEKDLVRLGPAAGGGGPILALRIQAVVYEPRPLIEALERALDAGPAGAAARRAADRADSG